MKAARFQIASPLAFVCLAVLLFPVGQPLAAGPGLASGLGHPCVGALLAQAEGSGGRKKGSSREASPKKGAVPLKSGGTTSPTPPSHASQSPTPGVERAPTPSPEKEAAGAGSSEGLLKRVVHLIRSYAVWIILVLAFAFAGAVWMFFGSREKPAPGESPFAELGLGESSSKASGTAAASKRFSSTKIQASDVNKRLAGSVKTTEVETDREYALVVDEDALKMPPLPEEAEEPKGRQHGDSSRIRKLIEEKDFKAAYNEYVRQIESDASLEFQTDMEEALSEHFLRSRELEKAARVLEHHVATHSKREIRAEAYFNLGYIHFMNRTLNKSRRFLKLFMATEKNPVYIERARKILNQLEKSGNLN